jgi:osmoprotectant transport system substrate-binding protein
MKKFTLLVLAVVLCILLLVQCAGYFEKTSSTDTDHKSSKTKGRLVIGAKFFTEQYILMKLTSIYLKENGYEIDERNNMESYVVRSGIEQGHIDMYWEYSGTAYAVFYGKNSGGTPERTYNTVKTNDEKKGLIWLHKTSFNNTFALVMKKDEAEKYKIQTISDLGEKINEDPEHIKIAVTKEFYERKDGLPGLQEKYRFKFPDDHIIEMDAGLTYMALKEGQVNVAIGFSTDSFLYANFKDQRYLTLADDQSYFPAYNAAPLVRKSVLEKYPEVEKLLNDIADRLDTETIMKLIYLVDEQYKDVSEVTRDWLQEQGLVK